MEKSFKVNRTQKINFTKEEASKINKYREDMLNLTGKEVSTNKLIKYVIRKDLKKEI